MPILGKAIEALTFATVHTRSINRHLDESRAIELFEALRDAGIEFGHDDVYRLAIENKWLSRHASELAELADLISAGERVTPAHRSGWGRQTLDGIRTQALA